jgi:hypothetical protein
MVVFGLLFYGLFFAGCEDGKDSRQQLILSIISSYRYGYDKGGTVARATFYPYVATM